MEGDRRRSPLLTVCVLVATSALSIVGFVYHGVLDALEREPGVLARDEWWRLLTPLLVNDGGWPHLAANAALVVVGVSVERAFGRRLWLALYLAGGLAGELADYAWQSPEVPATPWRCAGWRAGFSPRSSWGARRRCAPSAPSSSRTGSRRLSPTPRKA
jgi:rhomboid protease GluP